MLVILSGVSGAGKDTIKKELIARMPNIVTLPSFTSREESVLSFSAASVASGVVVASAASVTSGVVVASSVTSGVGVTIENL